MTTEKHEADGCLMCVVRALTEGTPETWFPGEPGSSVKGVVLAMGMVRNPSQFVEFWDPNFMVQYVDLWLGGVQRARVLAFGATMRNAIDVAAPQIGDTMTVTFVGYDIIQSGKFQGKQFRKTTVTVDRGHH